MKNAFVKLRNPWQDLIINPHEEQPPPNKFVSKNCCPSTMRNVSKKVQP